MFTRGQVKNNYHKNLWITWHNTLYFDKKESEGPVTRGDLLRCAATCPHNKIAYMTHDTTWCCEMSLAILRRMVLVTSHRSRWRCREGPRLVYLQSCHSATCCTGMSHKGTECAGDILSARHVAWIQTSGCIKLHKNIHATHGNLLWWRVTATCHSWATSRLAWQTFRGVYRSNSTK